MRRFCLIKSLIFKIKKWKNACKAFAWNDLFGTEVRFSESSASEIEF